MPVESKKVVVSKFPLRLMPSVRRSAETYSLKEGVSLNQFINVAGAEKLAVMQQEEWLRNKKKPTKQDIDRGHKLLEKAGKRPTERGDELHKGYVSRRSRSELREKAS